MRQRIRNAKGVAAGFYAMNLKRPWRWNTWPSLPSTSFVALPLCSFCLTGPKVGHGSEVQTAIISTFMCCHFKVVEIHAWKGCVSLTQSSLPLDGRALVAMGERQLWVMGTSHAGKRGPGFQGAVRGPGRHLPHSEPHSPDSYNDLWRLSVCDLIQGPR